MVLIVGHEEYSKNAIVNWYTQEYIKNYLDVAYSTITMINLLVINEYGE